MLGNQLEPVVNGTIELALFGHAVPELAQLSASREMAEPQKVASLFKSGIVSQFVDIYAPIGQDTALPIDIANTRSSGDNSL
jgi:hypothetical protein